MLVHANCLQFNMASTIKNSLKLGLLNVRSLNTGRDELEATLETYKPDLLALNETWLQDETVAPVLPGYVLKHKPRKTNRRGGGVGFYIRKGLRARVRAHPDSQLEQLWLELTLPGARMSVGTAYRPESVKLTTALDALSESFNVCASCEYVCLLTDFNVDLLSKESHKSKELTTFISHLSLEQVVKEPTRMTDESESLIDLIITNVPDRCKKVTIIHNRCLSDHALVLSEFNIKKAKPMVRFIETRAIRNISIEVFNKDLKSIPWQEVIDMVELDTMIEAFNELIVNLFNKHAPLRRVKLRDTPKPWITEMIRFMMKLRDKALLKSYKKKTSSSKAYYKSLKSLVVNAIEREKTAFFTHYINRNLHQPKELWSYLKKIKMLNVVNTAIPNHLNDPNLINDYFLTIPGDGRIHNDTLQFFKTNKVSKTTLSLEPVTLETINKIIINIHTNAAGFDRINADMLKLTLPETLPVILAIINRSIETNVFPNSWKRALVKPIPKTQSVEQLKDLRPISILPVLSKVLERVVFIQLEKFIRSENIIPPFQSGFRKGHGTETALIAVTDDLITASDAGLSSALILLDFSRAFDCLNPEMLIAKLSYYGFSNETCKWFRTFLTGREQCVETEGFHGMKLMSSVGRIRRGVPQGSILSPILFSIFTADLPYNIVNCKYHLYADDTQLYFSFDANSTLEAISLINDDLNKIFDWANRNSLVLNPEKSKMLILGTTHQTESVLSFNPRISINQIDIPIESEARNLGLVYDSELRFITHVNEKIKAAFYKIKVLYGIRKYISEEIRMLLCDLLVLSPFNYCSAVYGPRLYVKTEKAIQRVQNACARFCFCIPRKEHVTPYLVKNNVLNMKARRELHLACITQKILWGKNPEYLFQKLTWIKDIHSLNTRSKLFHALSTPKHKTTRFKGSFKYSASKIWNTIPPPMRKKMSSVVFKLKYKALLLNRQKSIFEATFKTK